MATGTSSETSDHGTSASAGRHPLPYRTGAVAGVCAALFGYVLTVLLTAQRAIEAVGGPAPADGLAGLAGWKAVGWLFYGAHGVPIRFSDATGVTASVDIVGASVGSLAVLYVVPPVALLLAGGLVAVRAGARRPRRAAAAGATVVVGYAVALLAGSLLLGATLGEYTAAPALPFVSAVGYPLVFGAMGGLAAAALSVTPAAKRPETTESSESPDR